MNTIGRTLLSPRAARFFIFLGFLSIITTFCVGCRRPTYIPADWRPAIFSFESVGLEKKIFIPNWWYTRKPIDEKKFEVYFIHTEQNYTMGISVGNNLRERLVSRYPTAKEGTSGIRKRDRFEIVWRTGYYSNSASRWGEVEVKNFWRGKVLQFWYEHAPPDISKHFDLIVKQFLNSL